VQTQVGISVSLHNDLKRKKSQISDPSETVTHLMIGGKAVKENIGILFQLFDEILQTSRIDNQKRAIEMLKESKVRKESSILSNGHSYGASRLSATKSFMGYFGEVTGGLTSVRNAGKMLEMAENNWPVIQERLERMKEKIVRRGGMYINLTGDKEMIDKTTPVVKNFIESLPVADLSEQKSMVEQWTEKKDALLSTNRFEAFSMPSQINYVVKGGPVVNAGEEVSASYSVVTRSLGTGYLWDNVRVMGGAYGGFGRFSELTGRFTFMSYRDPNLKGTLDIYDGTADFLDEASKQLTDQDVLQSIIGAVGDLDSPMSADQKGYASFLQYLSGETFEDVQKWRDQVLQTNREDFKKFADYLRRLEDTGSVAVFGSQQSIDAANEQLPEGKKLVVEQAILPK